MSTAESLAEIELCTACTRGDLESVKRLIENRTSPWIRDDQGNTLFHLCCSSDQCKLEVLKYLISVSGIVDYGSLVNNEVLTLLHVACSSGKLDFVRFLFTQHQNAFKLYHDMHGHIPLYYACKREHVEIVKYVYDEDIELSFDDIYQCVKVSNWEIMKLLLQQITFKEFMDRVIRDELVHLGKLVTMEKVVQWLDQTTYYPLHYSVKLGYLNIVEFLITNVGFDLEALDQNGQRPLHVACEYSDNVDLVKYLIEVGGCNINAKTQRGSTPLHIACTKNRLEIVKLLLDFPKCDRKAADKYGRQALHIACAVSGNVELVRYLIEKGGCDVNARRLDGNTSLHIACEKNKIEIVQFLTSQSECNREDVNNDGQRPLHLACEFPGNLDLVKHLVEVAKCDINAKDSFGNAPLLIVCKNKLLHLAKYFSRHNECQSVTLTTSIGLDPKFQELLDKHNKYQQALKSQQFTYLRNVKCILTGPPGAGKSTLKKRLLNETLTIHSLSTGVVDAGIQIQSTFRKLQQESVIVPGLEKNIEWRRQSVDEEAFSFYDRLSRTSSQTDTGISTASEDILITEKRIEKDCEDIYNNTFEDDKANNQNEINSNGSNISSPMVLNLENEDVNESTDNIVEDCDTDSGDSDMTDIINSDSIMECSVQATPSKVKAVRTLSKTVQSISLNERAEYEQRLQESCEGGHATLNIIDTGGQPEFHEILPALITGPAINLLTFKLTEPLQARLHITYRSPSGETQPYETSFTHEEVIFRSLASIACLRENTIGWAFDKLPIEDDSEPAAFLIATHKDCVEDIKVKEVNEQLKMKIENSVDLFHDNLVQFSSEHEVIFPLDTINDQAEIEHLQSLLYSVMSHKFQKLPIPVSWYTFSVKLRKSEKPIHKLDTCFKIAQECGISVRDDFKSALWFLHHRVGSIMHYPEVEGLEDIVITDIQLVFDRITQLITSSFTFATTNNAAIDKEFHTNGRFTELHLKTLSSKRRDSLTPVRLVSLLKHLHIVAGPMKSKVGRKTEKYYFMPCALKPTTVKREHRDQSMYPAPLLIHFKCGYNPVGVFCCLVVHLLSTKTQSELKWTLSKLNQYRNKITFTVGKCCDQITLVSRVTYLEIWIDRKPDISEAMSLKNLCPIIYNVIDHGIKTVTESLHYIYKSRHVFGFPCTACEISTPHPAICEYEDPVVAQCVFGSDVVSLQEQHTVWFDKGISKKQVKDQGDDNLMLSELGNDLISSLDSGVAKRALVQCTDIITESNIDAFALARRLYSKEVISDGLYKRVRDKKTGDSNEDRLELVLDDLKSRITHNASIFISFLNILNDLTQQDLSVLIVRKYKELKRSSEKEHIIEGSTIQDVLVEKDDTYYQHKSGHGKKTTKTRLHKLKRRTDESIPTSSKKQFKEHDGQKKMNKERKKKSLKKPKLMESCSEQSGSSSDNDSEFSETSSKHAKKVTSRSSYRSKEISKKDAKRVRNESSISGQSDKRDNLLRRRQIYNQSAHNYTKQDVQKRQIRENRKKRSESNDSDQSDEDHLPQKQEVTKKHKSFKPAPSYDKSIGYGKELANRKTYQKKGIPSECVSSLATKRKMTQKVTSDKRLKAETNYDDDEDNSSKTQGTCSEQSFSESD